MYPDKEGIVRSVLIKCQDESYLRAVEHLVPLELECEADENVDSFLGDVSSNPDEESFRDISPEMTTLSRPEMTVDTSVRSPEQSLPSQPTMSSRPVRQAALQQRSKMQQFLQNDLI